MTRTEQHTASLVRYGITLTAGCGALHVTLWRVSDSYTTRTTPIVSAGLSHHQDITHSGCRCHTIRTTPITGAGLSHHQDNTHSGCQTVTPSGQHPQRVPDCHTIRTTPIAGAGLSHHQDNTHSGCRTVTPSGQQP